MMTEKLIDNMVAITERIREEAARLLQMGAVDVLIGYAQGWSEEVVTPCFVTDSSQVWRLIFNESCYHNLARYLVGPDGYLTSPFKASEGKPRVALVAKPSTLRTIVGLIQERQFGREDLVILGITDDTTVDIEVDVQVGQITDDQERRKQLLDQIQELEDMPARERWEWWDGQFSKCIRCYACRQVCPFCYCEQCIADENQPQWIERSSTVVNNRMWNTIRAFHMVGRCTGCGECDRACPVGIPLNLLNLKMAREVKGAFGYVAGESVDARSPLVSYRADGSDKAVR